MFHRSKAFLLCLHTCVYYSMSGHSGGHLSWYCLGIFFLIDYECVLSHVQLFLTPWTLAHQAPLSMGFSRQECWSRLPFPSPEDLPDPGIEPASLVSPALASRFCTTSTTWEALCRETGWLLPKNTD